MNPILPAAGLAPLWLMAASPLAAQVCCLPPYHAPTRLRQAEGSRQLEPFMTIARWQWLYHSSIENVLGGTRMRMRGDEGISHPGVSDVEIEILAGGSPSDPFSMSRSFPANRGANFTRVFDRKRVLLPALTGQPGPQPFDIVFQLDRPLPVRNGENLLVELVVYGTNVAAAAGYAVDSTGFDLPTYVHTGNPCNGALQLVSGQITSAQPTLQVTCVARSHFASGPALLLLGTGPLPAPLPLPFPGGCAVLQDVVATVFTSLNGSGQAQLALPLPIGAKGFEVQSQYLAATAALDLLAATQTTATTIGGHDAVATLWTQSWTNQNGNISIAETGTVTVGAAPVLQFH